ncbi:hypothetical protein BCR35DRAFT_350229 [Leucosporidium creatinivorum]|uniref:DUF4038 domain-containing protein n=1 Tax=Leucosporidium creatinivorum TaxID=106004 RepID=A0A1Y2G1H3_9BASI|nr:hypothetical protein BCR35DRAFT_350229 [Leucosporidium creatinivorum]
MTTPRSASSLEATRRLALTVSADGRQVERDGKPFFWLGDTAWETFHRLSKEEVTMYLKNRQSKGFNVAMMVIVAEHSGLEYPSRDGFYPFKGTPGNFDSTEMDPRYFDFVDWVVEEAASMDITIALVPTWGRYMNYGYYDEGPLIFDEENIKTLGAYVGERYPHSPFLTGGDSNRYWNRMTKPTLINEPSKLKDLEIEDSGPITEALAASLIAGAKKSEPERTPFISYHPASPWLPKTCPSTASHFFPDADWLSLDIIQSGHHDGAGLQGDALLMDSWKATSSYIPVRLMYNQRRKDGRPRPVMDSEQHYESTYEGFDPNQRLWGAADIRNAAFQAVFAGACGITYGVNSIWQMHNAESKTHPPIAPPTTAQNNWFTELDLPGSFHVGLIRKLIISLADFPARVPAQEIILSNTHEGEGENLISGLRSSKGLWALVYTPKGEKVTVHLKKAVGGKFSKAEWFHPSTAERQEAKGKVDEEQATFTPPTSGTTEEDWVLILTA